MRLFASIVAGLLLCFVGTQAVAEKRVALVVGNGKYQHAPNLQNPTNDAGAITLLLRSAGFDVVDTGENLGINDMRRFVRDFSERTLDADIAVIYYAGHGIEVGGINYLVPVDATLRRTSMSRTKQFRSIGCCRSWSPPNAFALLSSTLAATTLS